MDNNISKIKEHPAAGRLSFSLLQDISCLVEFLFHIVDKSADLTVAATVGNEKVICKNRDFCDINDLDIFSFFIA